MASPRVLVRVLSAAATFSSEAVSGALRDPSAPGVPAPPAPRWVSEIVRLVAQTISANPRGDAPTIESIERLLGSLTRRYGTLGRAVEALAEARRRDPSVRMEAALGWHHAMTASMSSVEGVLRKHPVMARELGHWMASNADRIDKALQEYERWVNIAPLDVESDAQSIAPEAEAPPVQGDAAMVMREVIDDKPLGDITDPAPINDRLAEAVERLAASGDPRDRVVAALARRDDGAAAEALALAGGLPAHERSAFEGERALLTGRLMEAEQCFRRSLRERDVLAVRLGLASVLLRRAPGSAEGRTLLETVKREAPVRSPEWTRATAMLGSARLDDRAGDRDVNVRHAVEHLEEAIGAINAESSPHWWAQAHAALGAAWLALPSGRRTENIQRAMTCFQRAHEVWSESSHPRAWAAVENSQGHAWEALPTGDRGENLRRAVECYESALRVQTRDSSPAAWATLMNNLGNAWVQLPEGDRASNVERAIECHGAALEVWSELGRRGEWAATQNNLGNAWALAPAEGAQRGDNLTTAVTCYRAALEVRSREAHPLEWAATQNNLGNALLLLPGADDRTINEAIECFEKALSVRTKDALPAEWARTQANLGHAWSRLTDGNSAEHMERAVKCYRESLSVITRSEYPHHFEHIRTRLEVVQDRLDELKMLG